MDLITSASNRIAKLCRSLADKKFRDETGLFLVEGGKSVADLPRDAQIEFLLVAEGREAETKKALAYTRAQVYHVTESVMKSISDTVTPYGLAAAVRIPQREFALPCGNALLLDGVSDPGNLGTILRTAAATGFCDVYLLDCADVYAPKVVRASMGGVLRTRTYKITAEQAFGLVDACNSVALDMAGESLASCAPAAPVTYVAGNEAHGIRDELVSRCKRVMSLPMQGGMESLNVAVATAVAMYRIFIE